MLDISNNNRWTWFACLIKIIFIGIFELPVINRYKYIDQTNKILFSYSSIVKKEEYILIYMKRVNLLGAKLLCKCMYTLKCFYLSMLLLLC